MLPPSTISLITAWWGLKCRNQKRALVHFVNFFCIKVDVSGQRSLLPLTLSSNSIRLQWQASSSHSSSDIIHANLNALHAARSAFTESERSEWLHQALQNNISTYSNAHILTDDKVYYKSIDANQSSDILQHSQNRPTGDRWLKF